MSRGLAVSSALALALFISGCDCAGTPSGRPCSSSSECRPDESCVDDVCVARTDASGDPMLDGSRGDTGPRRTITAIRIEPETSELVAVDGARPSEDFEAFVVYDDGTEHVALGPEFTVASMSLGDLDTASGEFVANGAIGGETMVSVTVPSAAGLSASATVRVRIERNVRGDGVTDDDVTRVTAATPVDDAARSANVVYPLDGVVMPQNVYPADVQWTRSAAGDLFRVTISKPSVRIVAHLAHDPQMHWLVDEAAWRSLAQTDPDAPAELVVDRLEAASGQLIRAATIHVTFARAALTGSVYYWDIERGRIVRIDDGTATRNEFMPNPPPDPIGGQRCVGCHSVSNSGRYMAGRLGGGDNKGAIFDLTTDLSANPAPTVWPVSGSTIQWWFSSWSPDDTRMVVAYQGGNPRLGIVNPFTGADLPVNGTMPLGTFPAWSPSGDRIAFVAEQNGWGDFASTGNIFVMPVTIGTPDAVGAPVRVHVASTIPGATVDAYPTWSPDSAHLAFAAGNGARSESSISSLYMMSPTGENVVALTRASGTGADYQPRFSPFVSGSPEPQYYWLSFLSRRAYGNAPRGNITRPASRSQQIWVAAIRVGAAPGEDPSAVPYWLPGQNPLSANISAYWAPRPCREDGEGCSVGSECCGGDCRAPAGGGAPVCSPPPVDRCREEGETCSTTADCCEGMGDLTCIGRVCVGGPG